MVSGFVLRDMTSDDLDILFDQQCDAEAIHMAAFTAKDPTDREAFMAHWARILDKSSIVKKAIVVDGRVAGNTACFEMFGELNVSYWIDKEYWGRGLATQALAALLREVTVRPVYGRAAKDNAASIRVMQKCGFVLDRTERAFANARGEEIDEVVMMLEV